MVSRGINCNITVDKHTCKVYWSTLAPITQTWTLWATGDPHPHAVTVPRRTAQPAEWEMLVVLWGWVSVCHIGCPAFIRPGYSLRRAMIVSSSRSVWLSVLARSQSAVCCYVHFCWLLLHTLVHRCHPLKHPHSPPSPLLYSPRFAPEYYFEH